MKRIDYFLMCMIGGFITILLWNTLGKGYPDDFENYGSYMSQVMMLKESGGVWFTPNWYFGYELGRFYPPLATIETLLFGTIVGDMSLAFNLIAYTAFIGMGIALYVFLRGEFENEWAAFIAVLLFVTSHSLIVGVQGFYWEIPHLIGYALIPLLLMTLRNALKKRTSMPAVITGFLLGVILLHNILAGIEAGIFAVAYIAKMIASGWRPSKPTTYQIMVAGVAFIATVGWWVLPAIFPDGLGAYTKTENYSLQGLVKLFGSVEKHEHFYLLSIVSVPGILAVVGLFASWFKPKPIDWFALCILAITSFMVLSHSPQGWRYIVDMSLALAMLSGRLFERLILSAHRYTKVIAVAIGVAVVLYAGSVVDQMNSRIRVDQTAYKSSLVYIVEKELYTMMQPGDVAYIAYADGFHDGPMAFNLFFPDARQVGGGFFAGNRNEDVKTIGAYVKSGDSPKKLDALLQDYGVSYLVVNRQQLEASHAFSMLTKHYQVVYEYQDMSIVSTGYRTERASYQYHYMDMWRGLGLFLSLLGVCTLFIFQKK